MINYFSHLTLLSELLEYDVYNQLLVQHPFVIPCAVQECHSLTMTNHLLISTIMNWQKYFQPFETNSQIRVFKCLFVVSDQIHPTASQGKFPLLPWTTKIIIQTCYQTGFKEQLKGLFSLRWKFQNWRPTWLKAQMPNSKEIKARSKNDIIAEKNTF